MTRYELLDRIGVGGMAEIFRGKAIAAGGFEKPVAIKRILPNFSQDKRFVELLIAEAKVLSLLKHRNIVQIFDVGLGDDNQYFLVMEYVDGKDLGAIQRGLEASRRRLPFDLALHIGAEICEALDHAHSARAPDGKAMSLVHRDVSPSNVLLSRAGEVKLTDFGIAKRAEQEATKHGAVRGKFAYISPEQARNEPVDPRSDVFSIGILLWEMVTQRRLFSGLGDLDALRAVREAQIPRPRDVDPGLPADVDALIMSALSRDSRGRPTAGLLAAKLRSLRYSLEATIGDPATELAKIIDTAEEIERKSERNIAAAPLRIDPDVGEATVIRIHTADAFSTRDQDGTGITRAREVIDRFDEEVTRQAELSRDQLAFLRSNRRDSGELTVAGEPPLPGVRARRPSAELTALGEPPLPGVRARPPTDEPTRAHAPLSLDEAATFPTSTEPNQHLPAEEATRLVAPASRRTPPPQRVVSPRPPTQPPPMPAPTATPAPRVDGSAPMGPSSLMGNTLPGTGVDRASRSAPMSPLAIGHPQPPVINPSTVGRPPAMQPAMTGPGAPLPPMPPLQGGGYPSWGPAQQHAMGGPPLPFDRPVTQGPPTRSRKAPVRPWMLVIGALLMAALAFAVTRAFIQPPKSPPAAGSR